MPQFNYLIIGGGLAGLQLAIAFAKDKYFADKKIGLVEPSNKSVNDKTWCFWEKGSGQWDSVVFHQWKEAQFNGQGNSKLLDMGNYQYKMVRSIDFYKEAKKIIETSVNIEWIQDEIQDFNEGKYIGKKDKYSADLIFDSRIDEHFYIDKESIQIKQHFKGWFIETGHAAFSPSSFTMMDYSIGHEDHCYFTYVLPVSTTKALVEATFFTKDLVQDKVYDTLLKNYIHQQLSIETYEVNEIEKGIIPMSNYQFHQKSTSNYLKIGTAGGWVKASSGYSFKNTERKVKQVLINIKSGKKTRSWIVYQAISIL